MPIINDNIPPGGIAWMGPAVFNGWVAVPDGDHRAVRELADVFPFGEIQGQVGIPVDIEVVPARPPQIIAPQIGMPIKQAVPEKIEIEFEGVIYKVPHWTKFITQTANGVLAAWSDKPRKFHDVYVAANHESRQEVFARPEKFEQICEPIEHFMEVPF